MRLPTGKELKKLSIDFDLTSTELARAVGVSRRYLYSILNDHRQGDKIRAKLALYFIARAGELPRDCDAFNIIQQIKA